MRLTLSRCLSLAAGIAMLALTACAPQNNPPAFPSNTSTPAASATAASDEGGKEADSKEAGAGAEAAKDATAENAEAGTAAASDTKADSEDKASVNDGSKWEFVITDKELNVGNAKPEWAENVVISVANNTEDAYMFMLEGKPVKIESIAAGETASCKFKQEGPGPLAVSVRKISTDPKMEYPVRSISMEVIKNDPAEAKAKKEAAKKGK